MKKFIALLALVMAILALSVASVSAAAGYADDFNEPPVDGKVENYPNWQYYSAGNKAGVTWEDGMIRVERLESNGVIWNVRTNLNSAEGFVMMDVKLNEKAASEGLGGYYYAGNGARVSPSGFSGLEPDVWYRVLMLSTLGEDGTTYYSMFAKKEGTDEWVKRSGPVGMDPKSEASHIRLNWSRNDGRDIGCVMYIDNIEAHEGLYWEDLTLTDDLGTEIAVGDAISENATALTVTANIYNAKTLKTDMATNPVELATVPVVVAYDANGMMLDCSISEYGIGYFENTIEATLNLGDYDNSEIASVKFYLWDGMEGMLNVMEPVEMK